MTYRILCLGVVVATAACGAEAATMPTPTGDGSRGVTFGGAADIGQFRASVSRGEVPRPSVLDPVGFFAEHAVALPAVDCGADICLQSGLAVAPKFNGDDWTMGYVAMRTQVTPESLRRRPTHVVVAVERGYRNAEQQLPQLYRALDSQDRVSVLRFGTTSETVYREEEPGSLEPLERATGQATDLFLALSDAIALAKATSGELIARVILITRGPGSLGISEPSNFQQLVRDAAREGIPTTVITGDDETSFSPDLAIAGGGSFYFASDADDFGRVLTLVGSTTLHPIATDVQLTVQALEGYRIGRVFGAPASRSDSTRAVIDTPALYVGAREGVDLVDTGRRGGGGGFFVELIADDDSDRPAGHRAFEVALTYRETDGHLVETASGGWNVLSPGKIPDGMWPAFSDAGITKPFMMLNMYLGLLTQLDLYDVGDCERARGVLPMMKQSVDGWQEVFDDPDIDADFELMRRVDQAIDGACGEVREVIQPMSYSHASCMMI